MKWLKRKLRNWLREDEAEGSMIKSASPDFDDETVRFSLTSAVGGRILQVNRYSATKNSLSTSRNESTTYVIPSGEDVGERVTKILNLELMK